jgi:spore coat polysaccharide biosynthesis protein SpsF
MLSEIGIIVQARMSSSRLPGKSLHKIGGKPLIWYVLSRLAQTGLPVIVCTSTDSSDDVLWKYLKENEFPCYRGSLDNVLQRYIATAESFGLQKIVRITGDNPFVDINYLKEALPLFNTFNYIDGIYEKGLIKGTGFELVALTDLKRISSLKKEHLEHVTLWLREHIEKYPEYTQLQPTQINHYQKDVFLTCDYPEDMRLISSILENFNYKADIPLSEILQFLERNGELKKVNEGRHQ